MDSLYVESLSKNELRMIVEISDLKLEKTPKNDEIFNNLATYYKEVHNESPFKSIILDLTSILPKKRCKKIKKYLKYIEEIKELTFLLIENVKNRLIKLRNDLVKKFKKNDRLKKADRDCYGYKDNNLFDQNDDDIYEGIEYLFDINNYIWNETKWS